MAVSSCQTVFPFCFRYSSYFCAPDTFFQVMSAAFSCDTGTSEQRGQVRSYAQALGRAFQVRDDMLDVTSSEEELGKPVGSDRANGKNTFVTSLGLEGCAALVERLTREGIEAISAFEHPDFHIKLAQSMARRTK